MSQTAVSYNEVPSAQNVVIEPDFRLIHTCSYTEPDYGASFTLTGCQDDIHEGLICAYEIWAENNPEKIDPEFVMPNDPSFSEIQAFLTDQEWKIDCEKYSLDVSKLERCTP